MKLFAHAHATHPDWRMAVALAAAQIDAQRLAPGSHHIGTPTLGWAYLSDHYGQHAAALLADLQMRWPGVAWVGAVGIGVAANGVEYFDEPALALMLSDLPRHQFQLFSGVRPLGAAPFGFTPHTAQIHADTLTADLGELIVEMSQRVSTGYLFGGLASSRTHELHIADGVFHGGLSGVVFGPGVGLVSRVTQGCQPVGPVRQITESERNVVGMLDGEPALDCLLRDLGADEREPRQALPLLRRTLAGLSDSGDDLLARPGQFGTDTRVRDLIGIDPHQRGLALNDAVQVGMQLAFCKRNAEAARRDLVRICAEIREELEPESLPFVTALALQNSETDQVLHPARRIAGAIYVSCVGRGGEYFGGPSAEMATLRHALGDVPLVGFFAGGEIARRHLYSYTGVLTVFTGPTA